ncbi:hypothetical protein H0H81_009911 [Sphagnurus paluster]|uniref:beta-galactosidase n=1 Tax=Sphagnurus paluster TaxID=117069 RepID=A0A9P7GUE7_9AGAR|nr:hypothetical protein H0H81_009911 [Sphagnurus paluster]
MSTTLLNLYMIFGGTNWGGISHPGVYTSYDYGSAIAEDRTLREKYYELKLQANFMAVSPAYLTTRPQNIYNTQGSFTGNQALKTTQVLDVVGKKTGFYVVRQTDASTNAVQTYTLQLPTSIGTLTIPTIGGSLALNGKDSKIHVVDYAAGSSTILYSTAEIFTWATIDGKDVIIVYGNAGELHETAFKFNSAPPVAKVISGSGTIQQKTLSTNNLALQFKTTGQTVVQVGNALLYILDRANAYQFWVLYPPTSGPFAQYSTQNPIIVKGGYLLRSVTINGGTLNIQGDLNKTANFEIIAPAASSKSVTFNGEALTLGKTPHGTLTASRNVKLPDVTIPNLSSLNWKSADSLPEIQPGYSDAKWTVANKKTTVNPTQPKTPVVLYSGEYGYHTGNIIWRAHFTATGQETAFKVDVWGGSAFGYSVWLDSTFIGSWVGDAVHGSYESTLKFPSVLKAGSEHVLTILTDHMGYEEDWWVAGDAFKQPRGIYSYSFIGAKVPTVSTWKVAGNVGGESEAFTESAKVSGGKIGMPESRNLMGNFIGWHLPGFNDATWASKKPTDGISTAGVSFYRTTFDLNIPKGVDYPLALVVSNSTANPFYRSQFYVNGYQFGKYVNNIGPQTSFPVPQGILNYNGQNTLAVSLWAEGAVGAKLNSIALELRAKVESSIGAIVNQPLPSWSMRPGAN